MTGHSTHGTRYIWSGFLLALLVSIWLAVVSPTSAGPQNSAALSATGLRFAIAEAIALPHNPRHHGDTSDEILENERDDNLQGDFTPVHVIDHFYADSLGASARNIPAPLFPASPGDSYHLPAIYLLTQRFRI